MDHCGIDSSRLPSTAPITGDGQIGIRPEHILPGLLRDPDYRTGRLLDALGITIELAARARAAVSSTEPSKDEIALTAAAEKVLKVATSTPQLAWPEGEPLAPAPAPARARDSVLDVTALSELTGGDTRLVDALLDDFVQESRLDLASVRDVYERRSTVELRRQARRISGASRIVVARGPRDRRSHRAYGGWRRSRLGALGTLLDSLATRWRVSPPLRRAGAGTRSSGRHHSVP